MPIAEWREDAQEGKLWGDEFWEVLKVRFKFFDDSIQIFIQITSNCAFSDCFSKNYLQYLMFNIIILVLTVKR